jgi:hypothetical protein
MKRPKGPQLKLPELKAPDFLADLYYDLRDRRLLPLIALVLVAIVATPFLLGRDAESTLPATPPAIQALKDAGGSERVASLTVVEATPGLRDYRKRLRGRQPLDPFRSVGKPSLKGARLGKGAGKKASSSSSSFTSTSTTVKKTTTKEGDKTSTTTTTTTTNGSGDGGKKDEKGSGEGGTGKGGDQVSTYTIDVQISIGGQAGATAEPLQRKGVQPLTPLPGEETPVITYLGPNPDASRGVFTVSRDVTGVYGEVKCVAGTDSCEVIELEPGFPVTFVYGPDQTRYRIVLLKIEPTGGG